MSSNHHEFDNERHQKEWDAQERALRLEWTGVDRSNEDVRVTQYRMLARALRDPPLDPIPIGFAGQTAAWVQTLPPATDERIELWLQRVLCGLLAIAAVGVTALYGGQWLQRLVPAIRDSGNLSSVAAWVIAIAVCIVFSKTLERWLER